jgi:hypothetical protein
MWKRKMTLNIVAIITYGFLGLGLIFFIISFIFIFLGIGTKSWVATSGRVIKTEIERKHKFLDIDLSVMCAEGFGTENQKGAAYRPVVYYEYIVDSKKYIGKRIEIGGRCYRHAEPVQKIIDAYLVDSSVTVYYSPDRPQSPVLKPGVGSGTIFAFCYGIIFILLSISISFLGHWGPGPLFHWK